jgi:RNA polymerase sigma-70 factor (ECF subfamily)
MRQEQAFLESYDQYADALYRHAFFRISDPEKARDIVSDTFTRTWDYLVKGKEVDEFRPFLYRTLNHLIIDEYRKKRTESLDAMLDEADVPEGAFDELVEGSQAATEFALDAKRVHELLDELPEHYRAVVVMRYFDGLLPSEIADMLEESVNTVSVRIHRGVALLQKRASEKNL